MNVEQLSAEELYEELETFEDFASLFGEHYLTEAGLMRMKALQDEQARRTAALKRMAGHALTVIPFTPRSNEGET